MSQSEPSPRARETEDWIRRLGTFLVGVGVSMWIVYAVGRYWLGWAITDRGFLPYHLATILPGMILRYHAFLFEELPARVLRRRPGPDEGAARAQPRSAATSRALAVLNGLVHELATGLWAACVVAIGLLDRRVRAAGPGELASALLEVTRSLFWLDVAALAVVLATGALGRARGGPADAGERLGREIRRVKGVLFAFAFVGGTYFAYLCAFKRAT